VNTTARTILSTLWAACCLTQLAPAQQCRVHVLVAYYSATGHTAAMAEAVAAGATSISGTDVQLATVGTVDTAAVLQADAIAVGSPVYNANVAPAVLEFMATWPFDGRMGDKVGAAFVSAGGISAGEEATQLSILRSMLVFGMVVLGGPEWPGAFGASAITAEAPFDREPGVAPQFLSKARRLGERLATVTHRLKCRDP